MYDPYENNEKENENGTAPQTPYGGEERPQPEYRQTQYTESPYSLPNGYAYRPKSTLPQYAAAPQMQQKKKKSAKWVWIVLACLVGCVILAGCFYFGVRLIADRVFAESGSFFSEQLPIKRIPQDEPEAQASAPALPYTTVQSGSGTVGVTLDVVQVAEDTMPAMVSIDVVVTRTVQDPFGGFGSYFGFGGYEQDVPGSGSGIIIGQNDTELMIVTNNHVVGDAKEIAIKFIDGESASAYTKGTDETYDLAVVAVPIKELKQETLDSIKIAVMGDSDSLKLGEPAIAIGNALGYGQSVTVGYISALHREVNLTDGTMTLIQTDAAINPGNSGGALLNMRGEVVGINSAKYSDTDVEGMGYAIPITDAIPIINELMNSVVVPDTEKPYLGIVGQTVPESYRSYFDWPEGVYVSEITPESPAALAGLKSGDIIIGFSGETIETMEELQAAIAECAIGDQVKLDVVRTKRDRSGEIILEDLELYAILIARSEAQG